MSIANTQAETIIDAGIIENNDQVNARIENLKEIGNLVGNVYPNKFDRSEISGGEDTISNLLKFSAVAEVVGEIKNHISTLGEGEKPDQELKAKLNEKLKELGTAKISGRLTTTPRTMGKAAFVHLSDGINRLQIYVRRDDVKGIANDGKNTEISGWDLFKLLDGGDFIGVGGYLFLTNTGELSVHVETIRFLSKSLLPMPDKMHGIADAEISRRYRYADLIASSLRNKTEEELEEEKRTGIKQLTTREVFERRAKLISGMRRFLDDAGYIEVETPMLTPKATGAAAEPFETYHKALDIPLYARIAPELYLKRLTVGGFEKVYELNRNFRNEGLSMKHNPEFTMLEFYCAYMDVNGMMDFAEAMIKESVQKATGGSLVVNYDGKEIDFSKFERLSMKDAIAKYWKLHNSSELSFAYKADLSEMTRGEFQLSWLEDPNQIFYLTAFCESQPFENAFLPNVASLNIAGRQGELVYVARENPNLAEERTQQFIEKLNSKSDESEDVKAQKCLVKIFETLIEPVLTQPTFIVDYPKSISPLSKASPDNPNIAERFELFINGMECANGFSELNDPQEQFERFVDQMKEREGGDVEAMVLDEDYIRALSYGMPPAAGIGIGIDRLVMLLTNKHSIRDVILFPHMRPIHKEEEKRNEAENENGETNDEK